MRFDWYLIKRACRFWWQRRTRGWDDSETWSLEHSLAKHIAPRLRRFKELTIGIPGCLLPQERPTAAQRARAEKKWDEILDDMIYAYEFIADHDKYFLAQFDSPEWKRVNRGRNLFHKYYYSLWW